MENDLARGLDVRRNVRRWFYGMGLKAEAGAKAAAPVLTGALRASINFAMIGADLSAGGMLTGRLQVGVVYGRRQEWEHRTKSFYAYRALRAVADEISVTLQSDAPSVWIGVGRGWKGTWSYNPGMQGSGVLPRSSPPGSGGAVVGSFQLGGG
jgi:hypothetical protein